MAISSYRKDSRVRELEHRLRGYPTEVVRSCYRYYMDDPYYLGTPEHIILEKVYAEMSRDPRFGGSRRVMTAPPPNIEPTLEPLGEPPLKPKKPNKTLLLL